ncbi:MAG: tetratricopeptide repeat protein [Planctomycetota bacterium]
MALFDKFKKKKGDDTGDGNGGDPSSNGSAGAGASVHRDPAKAKSWFQHAQAAHDATNYEAAMTYWLGGIKLDPENLDALERFASSAMRWRDKLKNKVKGPTKEQRESIKGKGEIVKYLDALLTWGAKGFEWPLGLKAMAAANKCDIDEAAFWLGERVFARLTKDDKAKKDNWVELMHQFEACNGFDWAVKAGEQAIQADPTDGALATEVKNLSAQSAMAEGGFDESNKEGGFRDRVKDATAQQQLSDDESLVKGADAMSAQIARAKADYQARMDDLGSIEKYARALRQRGTAEDLQQAYKVLKKGHEDTQVFRLKEQAGEVELRFFGQAIEQLERAIEKRPDDADAVQKLAKARAKRDSAEMRHVSERVAQYPTDLRLKYELGKLHFKVGDYEQAIKQLQKAKDAQGVAGQVMRLLGYSFLEMGWIDEATTTFRGALEGHRTPDDELGLELRYGLMRSLRAYAETHEDGSAADESFEIASRIAIEQIGFKDNREQREALVELRKKLKDGG